MSTVVVGAHAHRRTHTCVAVGEVGRKLEEKLEEKLDEKVVATITAAHRQAVRWARDQLGAQLVWAIEDRRRLLARSERDLLAADQKVVRVPPKLMAQTRASARTRGKPDPIDVLAVGRAFLREPDLPVACHDTVSRELKLLVDRREDVVAQWTSTINRLQWRVLELDPSRAPKPAPPDPAKHRDLLRQWRLDAADSSTEALRRLKRRIAPTIFSHLHTDDQTHHQPCQPATG